jgi:hypothetical protein
MSFLTFVNEVTFNDGQTKKALKILEKRLRQKFGAVYRYGGPSGTQDLENGGKQYTCYLYFIGATGKAIRVNTVRNEWVSIDMWKKFSFTGASTLTADLTGVENVAPFIDDLIDRLKTFDTRPIEIYFGPDEGDETVVSESVIRQIDEAKRTTVQDFYNLCLHKLTDRDLSSVTWNDINLVAKENDLLVPYYFRTTQVGKGSSARYNLIPPGVDSETAKVEEPEKVAVANKKGSNPIMYIKVTAQDPVSKRFLPSGENDQAQALYKQIQKSLEGPAPDRELTDVTTLFGNMVQLTSLVCKGNITSLLVAGGPGIGKSFDVFKTIKGAGLVDGVSYVKFSGKATATAIYQTLFKWRQGGVIVFDDCDSVWGDEDSTNMLKAALDSYDERAITWLTGRTVDVSKMPRAEREVFYAAVDQQIEEDPTSNKIKYPAMFPFEGRVIFISNLPFKKFDTAILSRSAKIDMTLTQDQVFERMRSILPDLGGRGVPLDKKEEILDFLEELYRDRKMVSVTLREFTKAIKLVEGGVPNWKSLLSYL